MSDRSILIPVARAKQDHKDHVALPRATKQEERGQKIAANESPKGQVAARGVPPERPLAANECTARGVPPGRPNGIGAAEPPHIAAGSERRHPPFLLTAYLSLAALVRTVITRLPLPERDEVILPACQDKDDPLRVLSDLNLDPLFLIHTTGTILAVVLDAILTTADERSQQHLQVAGGTGQRTLHFTLKDLVQAPPRRELLRLNLASLCRKLLRELPLCIRLFRQARSAYGRDTLLWKACLEAGTIVLLRILQTTWTLRTKTSRWVTDTCVQWALRRTWETLFGPGVEPPASVGDLLDPIEVTVYREREILQALTAEEERQKRRRPRRADEPPPAPIAPPEIFAAFVARWGAEGVPEALTSSTLTWEMGQEVRGFI